MTINTVKNSFHAAKDAVGVCIQGNENCIFSQNDTLGLPSITGDFKTFSNTNALIMADLVGRISEAAGNDNPIVDSPPNFTPVKSLHPDNDPIFSQIWSTVQSNTKTLYIGFRGTMTTEEWRTDFQSTLQGVIPTELKNTQSQTSITENPDFTNIKIHKGFLEMFNDFKEDLTVILEEEQPDRIFVAGHSLGAAIATLFGLQFYNDYNLVIYTFGSPRVGNTEFSDFVKNNYTIQRIYNRADLVSDVPLSVMFNTGGTHIPYIYKHAGISRSFNLNWEGWMNNHSIPIFLYCLGPGTSDANCNMNVIN